MEDGGHFSGSYVPGHDSCQKNGPGSARNPLHGILFTVFTKCGGPNREDDSAAWFWGGDVGTAESSGAVGEVAGGREKLPEGGGGRRKPKQRWPTGPCTRTNPALVTGIIRRQTLQGARIVEESRAVSSAILSSINLIIIPFSNTCYVSGTHFHLL